MSVPDGWEGILEEGERILWQGRPDARVKWSEFSPIQTFVGVLFTAAGYNALSSMIEGPAQIFMIVPLAIAIMGLYFVGGHFLWSALRRSRTHYTLTNRRAFIAVDLWPRKSLTSYPIGTTDAIELDEGVTQGVYFAEEHRRSQGGSRVVRIGFQYISDAREVLGLMRNIQRGRS